MIAILAAADADDLARGASLAFPLIALLYEGGGRITETLATDFTGDPSAPGLDLWSDQAEWRIPRENTKTRTGEREVPLDEDLRQVLLAHWRALGEPAMGTPVFPSRRAARATRGGAVREAFRRIEAATGIARICAHNFRRTNSTDLLEANVPLNEAAARLGHANGAFLLRFYAQPTRRGQVAASEQLNDYRRSQGVELRAAPGAGPDGGETPPAQVNGRPTATHESPGRPPQDAEVS